MLAVNTWDKQLECYQSMDEHIEQIIKHTKHILEWVQQDESATDLAEQKRIVDAFETTVGLARQLITRLKDELERLKVDNNRFQKEQAEIVYDVSASAQVERRHNLWLAKARKLKTATLDQITAIDRFRAARQTRQARRLKMVAPQLTDDKVQQLVNDGAVRQLLDAAILNDDLTDTVGEIEQRHGQMITVERQVRELYQLFADLAILVDGEQDSLNTIGKHVHNARDHVTDTDNILKDAAQHQQSARKRQCCIVTVLVVALTVIVLPVVITMSKQS